MGASGLKNLERAGVVRSVFHRAELGVLVVIGSEGVYSVLLTYQRQPIDPDEDAIEDEADIRAASDELMVHGYAVRVEAWLRPLSLNTTEEDCPQV